MDNAPASDRRRFLAATGSTTTLMLDVRTLAVQRQFRSLAGTLRT